MRNLRLREMMLIYIFGNPELDETTDKLLAVATLATSNRMKQMIMELVSYLNEDGVAEWYERIYYDILRLFSPDDGTRPPEAGALKVPECEYLIAA
jgi:hypothetical protein